MSSENKFMKIMPKQLTNQLNLIKKDKEIDEQRQQKMHSDDGVLQSDRIIQSQLKKRNYSNNNNSNNNNTNSYNNRNSKRDDNESDDENDKWQKILPKQKQIKKISINSVKDNIQKWQKNSETTPIVVVSKPKKKITIQRDESGKVYFEEEVIQPVQSKIVHYQQVEQKTNHDMDSLDDSHDNDDEHRQKDNQESYNKSQQQTQNGGRRLSIKKNISKQGGYMQADNLPVQIDNTFFKDLLKKEKDHILETYRQDNFGRVKFSSKEAVERSINILNKRTLYGQQVSAYEISSEDYERHTDTNHHNDRNQISNRIQSKNRK